MTEATETVLVDDKKDDAEKIEVVVDAAENTEQPVAVSTEAAPAPKAEITPEEGIEDLRRKLADSNRAADNERQARLVAEQRANAARDEAKGANLEFVKSAIDALKRDTESLKKTMVSSMQSGDYDKIGDLQEAISTNVAKLMQLENGRAAMETAPRRDQPPVHSDPVEAVASTLSARSAEWVRKHPDYARDQRKLNQMVAAHNLAVASDYQPDTDGYFSFVEKTLGIVSYETRGSQEPDPMAVAAQPVPAVPVRRQAPPPAAPANSGGSGRAVTMHLSSDEVEMAEMMGMTKEQYAQNKARLIKEGKIGK